MASNKSIWRRRRVAIVAVVLGLIGVGIPLVKNRHVFSAFPRRFETVADGVLYRSAQPTTRQIANLVETYGIRTVLIVREGDSRRVPGEIAFARDHGLNAVRIPLQGDTAVPDNQAAAFFACVDDPRNLPVLIHCSAGRHRTGYLCALYRIERQGWSVRQATEEMLSFGFGTERHAALLEQLRRHTPGRYADLAPESAVVEVGAVGTSP